MKLGIDYHGVINSNPDFFKKFNALALQKNHFITILSGAHQKDVEAYLKEHQIPFSNIFSLLDTFQKKGIVTFYPDGSFFVANNIWNTAKAKYCLKNHIDLHIDDSMLYGTYFNTPFCLYTLQSQSCTIIKQNICIDFKKAPEQVLSDIETKLKLI